MSDLEKILARIRNRPDALAGATAATIVNTIGSSYRGPGARLLLEEDGTITGVISGGCLEADLLERAKKVRANRRPELITYDTSSPQDIVDGLGIGCNGKVQVLLEPWPMASESLLFAQSVLGESRRGVLATIYHVRGFPDVSWGTHVLIDENAAVSPGLADSNLLSLITTKARALMLSGATAVESLQVGVEIADVLFEVLAPPHELAIFGAGPGSPILARLAKELGWRVTLVDHRDKASYAQDFACADQRIIGDYAHIPSSLKLAQSLAAVVMSHSFAADLEYLRILIPSGVHYIGLLGSRSRSQELLTTLSAQGITVDQSVRDRLHNPVGLDIGAEGPEEIALAVLSEILAVRAGHKGGFLRDRKGPVHERPASHGSR